MRVPDVAPPGLRHHDLRRDVGAGGGDRLDQPRPGLPRHRRAARGARRRGRRHPRRAQPVPARPGHPRAAHARSPSTSVTGTASTYDPDTEVLVTTGATEAIAAALLALCEPGDEVVTFEPYYDSYAGVHRDGGRAPDAWCSCGHPTYDFDPDALAAAITPRTRLVLLNSPHNPTGKVFARAELEAGRTHCASSTTSSPSPTRCTSTSCSTASTSRSRRSPACASAPSPSRRAARRSRSPAGRWAGRARAPTLVAAVRTAKQFLTYVNAAPFQHGVAAGLRLPDERTSTRWRPTLREKRDRLADGLVAAGFGVLPAAGTYFVTADIRPARRARRPRVLPVAARALRRGGGAHRRVLRRRRRPVAPLVRFAFCKRLDVIDEAASRLEGAGAMKVAAVQHDIVWEDPAANLARLAPLIATGRRRRRAPRACSPRCSRPGSRWTPSAPPSRVDGPSAAFLARPGRAAAACGSAGRSRSATPGADAARRTRSCSRRPTARVHRYRKIHPFTLLGGEHERYDAGDALRHRRRRRRPRARCSSATTCASPTSSGRSPTHTDCYVVPANWPASRREHWRTLLRARAIENQAYVVGVNRVGEGGRLEYVGDSPVVGPFGEVLADGAGAGRGGPRRRRRPRARGRHAPTPRFLADRR